MKPPTPPPPPPPPINAGFPAPPPPGGMVRRSAKKELFSVNTISENFQLVKDQFEEILVEKNRKETLKKEEDSNTDQDIKRSNKIKDRYLFQCYKSTLLHELENLHKLIQTLENYPLLKKAILVELETVLNTFENDLNKEHTTIENIFNAAYSHRKIVRKKVIPPGFVYLISELEAAIILSQTDPDFFDSYKTFQTLQKEYEQGTKRNEIDLIEKGKSLSTQADLLFEENSRKLNETDSNAKSKPHAPTQIKTNAISNDVDDLTNTLARLSVTSPKVIRKRTLANNPLLANAKTSNTKERSLPLTRIKHTEPKKYTSTKEWKSFEKYLDNLVKIMLEKEKKKDALKKQKEIIKGKLDIDIVSIPENMALTAEFEALEEQIQVLENKLSHLKIDDLYAPFKDLLILNKKEIQLFYLYMLSHPPVMTSSSTTHQQTTSVLITTPLRDLRGFFIKQDDKGPPIPFEQCIPPFPIPEQTMGGGEWKKVSCPLGFLSKPEKEALRDFILPGEEVDAVEAAINKKIQTGMSDETLNFEYILSIANGLVFKTVDNKNHMNVNLHVKGSYFVEKLIPTIKNQEDITNNTAPYFQVCLIERLQNEKDIYSTIVGHLFEKLKKIFQDYYENKNTYHQNIAIAMLMTVLPTQPNPILFSLPNDAFSDLYHKINESMAQETKKQQKEDIMAYAFRDKERIKLLSEYLSTEQRIPVNLDSYLDLQTFDEFKKGIEDALDNLPELKDIYDYLSIPDSLTQQSRIEEKIKTKIQKEIATYLIKNIEADKLTTFLDELSEENKAKFIFKSMDSKTLLAAVPINRLKDLMQKQYDETKQNIDPIIACQRRDLYLANEQKIKEEKKKIAEETAQAREAIEAEKAKKDAEKEIKNRNSLLGAPPDENAPLKDKIEHVSRRVHTFSMLLTEEDKSRESNELINIFEKLINELSKKEKNAIGTDLEDLSSALSKLEKMAGNKAESLTEKIRSLKAEIFDIRQKKSEDMTDSSIMLKKERLRKIKTTEENKRIAQLEEEKKKTEEENTVLYKQLEEVQKKLEESITPESILDKDKSREGWKKAKELFMQHNNSLPDSREAHKLSKHVNKEQINEFKKFMTRN